MKRKKRIAIANLIVALLVAVFTVGYVFAWFADVASTKRFLFNGSSGSAYFAGGDGSRDDPFLITDQYHLYNLAWLQNTGKLDDRFYFALDNDVNILSDFWLPPIGNDEHPFSGEFDGRGHTVSGLKVTTNKQKLTHCPVQSDASYEFSRAVGMFGMTENEDEDTKCYIHNFILSEPYVEVSPLNTRFATGSNPVIGFAIGHLAGKANSIGVLADDEIADSSILNIGVATSSVQYSTFNSILGELDSTATAVTGGGHTAGEGMGANFGANFDIRGFYARIKLIAQNKYVFRDGTTAFKPEDIVSEREGVSTYLPYLDASNEYFTIKAGDEMAFSAGRDSTYEGPDARETMANDNTGYFFGNKCTFSLIDITYSNKLMYPNKVGDWPYYLRTSESDTSTDLPAQNAVPRWLYVQSYTSWNNSNYRGQHGFAPLSQEEFDELPQTVKDIVMTDSAVNTYALLRILTPYMQINATQNYGGLEESQWSYHGSINWMGKEYGSGIQDDDGNIIDENGYYITADGCLLNADLYKFTYDGGYVATVDNYPKHIYYVDEYGYALDQNRNRLDANGFDVDENGYAYNDEGYIINPPGWPFSGIDSEGYATVTETKWDSSVNANVQVTSRYLLNGEPVYCYGFGINDNGKICLKGQEHVVNSDYHLDGFPWLSFDPRGFIPLKVEQGTPLNYHAYSGGVSMPNNGVWFKPAQPGFIRFIMFAQGNGQSFRLLKLTRTNADKENPFRVDPAREGGDITIERTIQQHMPPWVFFYYEYEVTKEDIDAGNVEFWLVADNDARDPDDSSIYNGAYLVYLDLGAGGDGNVLGAIDPTKEVSAIDFIYRGVSIADTPDSAQGIKIGDFIIGGVRYEATRTSIYFENLSTVLQIVYVRKHSQADGVTMQVVTTPTATDEVLATKEDLAVIT